MRGGEELNEWLLPIRAESFQCDSVTVGLDRDFLGQRDNENLSSIQSKQLAVWMCELTEALNNKRLSEMEETFAFKC